MATQTSEHGGYKSSATWNFGFLAGAKQLRSEEEQGELTSKTRFLPGSLPAVFSKVFDDFGDVGETDKTHTQNAIHPNARWNQKPALGALASIYRENNEGNVRKAPGEEITTHPHDHYEVSNIATKMKKSLPSIQAKGKGYSEAVGNFEDNAIEFEEAFDVADEVNEEDVNHQDEQATADLDTSQLRVRAKTGKTPASFKETKRGGIHDIKDKEGTAIPSVASGKETMIESLKTGEARQIQHAKSTIEEADKLPMSQMAWAEDEEEKTKQVIAVAKSLGFGFKPADVVPLVAIAPLSTINKPEPATRLFLSGVVEFLQGKGLPDTRLVDRIPEEDVIDMLNHIRQEVLKDSPKTKQVAETLKTTAAKRKIAVPK